MELISKEELIKAIRDIKEVMLTNAEVIKTIDMQDVIKIDEGYIEELERKVNESRPKGVWVGIDQEPHEEWECCNCGNIIITYMQDELEEHKYCHKCGAKMSTPWADMRGEE